MIGAILGVANGLLPINPLGLFQGRGEAVNPRHSPSSNGFPSDSIELSRSARQANLLPVGGRIDVQAFRTQHLANLAGFKDEVGKIFAENGIDLTQSVSLRYDAASNRVAVEGAHPQRETIEALLDQFPRLAPALQRLEAGHRFLNAQSPDAGNAQLREALAAYRGGSAHSPFLITIPTSAQQFAK